MNKELRNARILRISDVVAYVGLSRSTIYFLIKSRAFPAPVKIGKCSCWLISDIDNWIENKFCTQQNGGEK